MGGKPIWINYGQENLIPLAPVFNRETAYRSRDASKGGAIKTLKELLRLTWEKLKTGMKPLMRILSIGLTIQKYHGEPLNPTWTIQWGQT